MLKNSDEIVELLTEIRNLLKENIELRKKSNEVQAESISIQKDALINVKTATERAQKNLKKIFLHLIISGIVIFSIISYIIFLISKYLIPYIR